MKIRFIGDKELLSEVIASIPTGQIIHRADGYFINKALLQFHKLTNSNDLIVYTDDEQLLDFADYSDDIHNFDVEIYSEKYEDFIPLKIIHPNIRKINSLTKMFMSGIIDSDMEEYENDGE